MEYNVTLSFKLELNTTDVNEAQELVDRLTVEELLEIASNIPHIEVNK